MRIRVPLALFLLASLLPGCLVHQLGGAFGRVGEDATAFGNRDAKFILNVWGVWNDAAEDAVHIA